MNEHEDLLQAYLSQSLSPEETFALEARLKTEPLLAEALIRLSQEEVILTEWACAMHSAADTELPLANPRPSRSAARRLLVWLPPLAAAAALCWFLFRPTPPETTPPADAYAKLEDTQGEVHVIDGQGRVTMGEPGLELHPGDEIRTVGDRSFALVTYLDGTRLELSYDTDIRLLSQGVPGEGVGKRLFLAEGYVQAEVAKQPDDSPMNLSTPHAVVRVLGTRFSTSASRSDTRVELEQGSVEVLRTRDGLPAEKVEVREGGYAVIAPQQPLAARTLPPRRSKPYLVIPRAEGPVAALAFSPDSQQLAVGGKRGALDIWLVEAGEPWKSLPGHKRRVTCLAWMPDGLTLLTGGDDKTVRWWDVAKEEERFNFTRKRFNAHALAVSPDGKVVAVATWLATGKLPLRHIDLHNARTGEDLGRLPGQPIEFTSLAFSPDSKLLASAGRDGLVRLWDVVGRRELATLVGHTDALAAIAFSPDGKLLASGGKDRVIRLWDVATRQVLRTLEGHPREVKALAFSPDSRWLVSGGGDNAARLWDVDTGKVFRTFNNHKHAITCVQFSPDGRYLATSDWPGVVRLWSLDAKE